MRLFLIEREREEGREKEEGEKERDKGMSEEKREGERKKKLMQMINFLKHHKI